MYKYWGLSVNVAGIFVSQSPKGAREFRSLIRCPWNLDLSRKI